MASPVGHVIVGLAVARAAGSFCPREPEVTGREIGDPQAGPPWLLPALAAFAAVAPDLDFLPGILVGGPNRFHQLQSHTIVATVAAGAVAGAVAWMFRLRAAMILGVSVGIAYASHLLLDYFTHDPRAPFGIPLFWPLSSEHFTSPWSLFRGILHGVPGQGLAQVLAEIFSLHNLLAIGIEVGATLPILLIAHLFFPSVAPATRRTDYS